MRRCTVLNDSQAGAAVMDDPLLHSESIVLLVSTA
jgi:hypothetical protein